MSISIQTPSSADDKKHSNCEVNIEINDRFEDEVGELTSDIIEVINNAQMKNPKYVNIGVVVAALNTACASTRVQVGESVWNLGSLVAATIMEKSNSRRSEVNPIQSLLEVVKEMSRQSRHQQKRRSNEKTTLSDN